MSVESELGRLQGVIRGAAPPTSESDMAMMARLVNPDSGQITHRPLRRSEEDLAINVRRALVSDIRFEHLLKPGDQVEEFISSCVYHPEVDGVAPFVAKYAKEPRHRTCYLPIESLEISTPLEVLALRLLPTDDPSLPEPDLLFMPGERTGTVAVVDTYGTGQMAMVERARRQVAHVLRVLRVAFRAEEALHERQLRFRLGTTYAFDDLGAGARSREDVAYGLEVIPYLVEVAVRQAVATAPLDPSTDLQRRVDVALRWMERATFVADPLVGVLFLFFALEALLGSGANESKAAPLAFRQMMLSHVVDGNFSDPGTTWSLYDDARSSAVHGEEIPELDEEEFERFFATIRRTLDQYLKVATEQGFVTRRQMRKFLDEHADRPHLVKWIKDRGSLPAFEKRFRDLVRYVDEPTAES